MTTDDSLPISPLAARLPRSDLKTMMRLVRLLERLSREPRYRSRVCPELPETARRDPGYASLMMGYDFHLSDAGPRLIEVNTNAGGGYFAWLSEQRNPEHGRRPWSHRYPARLIDSFTREWQAFSGPDQELQQLVILDEDPPNQPLYREMTGYRDWFAAAGISTRIADIADLQISEDGVYSEGQRVDLVYNRHCDFFLETPALQPLRTAYLAGSVCLSPNPFAYGLLADKRRMILWSDPGRLAELPLTQDEQQLLLKATPHSVLLADSDPDDVWARRKKLVFKPVTRFGGQGVLMGKTVTRKRFATLDPATTLVQEVVPPSRTTDEQGQEFKMDLRLFVYRAQLLGIAARLYRGQLTNLRTEGGGFAAVRLV